MDRSKNLEEAISRWPSVSTHPHSLGSTEFRFGSAEIGHIHVGGVVDIPFPRPVSECAPGGRSRRRAPLGSEFQGGQLSTSIATKTSSLPFG